MEIVNNTLTSSLRAEDVLVGIQTATKDSGIEVSTGQKVWVPFYTAFPPNTIVKIVASVMVPTEDSVAVFHISDIKFDDCVGKNILCTSKAIDLQRTREAIFEQTPNLTTFMQVITAC